MIYLMQNDKCQEEQTSQCHTSHWCYKNGEGCCDARSFCDLKRFGNWWQLRRLTRSSDRFTRRRSKRRRKRL